MINNLRVIAVAPLFYGEEYMEASIKSLHPFVDKIIILYTNHPSFSYGHDLKSPDDGEKMKSIALSASDKLEWIDVSDVHFNHEGEHRQYGYRFAEGYDVLIPFDLDEVFDPVSLPDAIVQCAIGGYRFYGVDGYLHFWRSFNWVNTDGFRPCRFVNLKNSNPTTGELYCKIYHMSYAQRETTMRHKFLTFGHAPEIRKNYLDEVYYAWKPDSGTMWLHPVSMGIWHNPEPFDKNTLPDVLKNHPNFNKEYVW